MRNCLRTLVGAALICGAGCTLLPCTAGAAVPSEMTVQGKLTDPAGDPAPAGAKTFTFKIFDQLTGGIEIWPAGPGEDQTVTTDDNGLWTARVGLIIPLTDPVFAAAERWLEITVDDGVNPPETLSRIKVNTSPYSYRISTVDGAAGGTITSKVSIGPGHINTGADGFVAGSGNEVYGNRAVVAGGSGNIASADHATIAGGSINDANGLWSSVGGGNVNRATQEGSTVGGGESNSSTGILATVAGGTGNEAAGTTSFVAGGVGNDATNTSAAVGGGSFNTAGGEYAVVAGGGGATPADGNSAEGEKSAICGGSKNIASNLGAFVGGGVEDTASGQHSAVAGGTNNCASGSRAFVGGGTSNKASGAESVVGGGTNNIASGDQSTIPGGSGNRATGLYSFAAGFYARAVHHGAFVWCDAGGNFSSSADGEFSVRAYGGIRMFTNAAATTGACLAPGSGTWGSCSDRNLKADVEPVDGADLLQKLAAIPVTRWRYTSQDASIRHIGPMAQDFYAAFGVGEDDKHITTIDADGVALAAIQELYKKTREIDELRAHLAALQKQIAVLTASRQNVPDGE